jgi:hypothetical protein
MQYSPTNELTAEEGINVAQINTWKKQAMPAIPKVFSIQKSE